MLARHSNLESLETGCRFIPDTWKTSPARGALGQASSDGLEGPGRAFFWRGSYARYVCGVFTFVFTSRCRRDQRDGKLLIRLEAPPGFEPGMEVFGAPGAPLRNGRSRHGRSASVAEPQRRSRTPTCIAVSSTAEERDSDAFAAGGVRLSLQRHSSGVLNRSLNSRRSGTVVSSSLAGYIHFGYPA